MKKGTPGAHDGAPMRVGRKSGTGPIGLGFRALKGGGVVVGVVVDEGDPRVVLSTFLPTAAKGDRLALEPYRVAYEMKRGPDGGASTEAAAAVAEGHKRQGDLAAQGLGDIVRKLQDAGCQPVIAALLVNRAGWITDALAYTRVASATVGGSPNLRRGSEDACAKRLRSSRSCWLRKRCHITTCPRSDALLSKRFLPDRRAAGYECGINPFVVKKYVGLITRHHWS